MSSEILSHALSLILLVECAIILWIIFGYVKKRLRPHKKEIFICGDCWLLVFDFLAPSQLGLEIALINRRFDCIVDEHFKTRKWKLGGMQICHEIGDNGTKQMQIVNSDENPLPIPQNPLPNKVIGFRGITNAYIDQNVIAFLRLFHRFFAFSSIYLDIITENVRILDFVLLNIWPMFRDSIDVMYLNSIAFRRFRQLAPSVLSDCPSLHTVLFKDAILPEFSAEESANATDGQALVKWLFTPCPNSLPKVLHFHDFSMDQCSSTIEQLKAAFSNASFPVTFRIRFHLSSSPIDFILPIDLINEVTGEKLILEIYENDCCLKRCPITWDERNWENVWEELSARQNPINIRIKDCGYDDGPIVDNFASTFCFQFVSKNVRFILEWTELWYKTQGLSSRRRFSRAE